MYRIRNIAPYHLSYIVHNAMYGNLRFTVTTGTVLVFFARLQGDLERVLLVELAVRELYVVFLHEVKVMSH